MHIYCGISFHGFGHLSQSAPIIKALSSKGIISELTVHCEAPKTELQRWFTLPFRHIPTATDLGMPMVNALQVDAEETYRQYLDQHLHRDEIIKDLEHSFVELEIDLVLSNNSHLLSRAAKNLNIPCFHFCSLNWADNYLNYCSERPLANEIYHSLCSDYNAASNFFRLPPYMPMPGFDNLLDVGPVSRSGTKFNIGERLGKPGYSQYVLVSMGGMPYSIPFHKWPNTQDTLFINGGTPVNHLPASVLNVSELNISHLDLVTNCDVVITKPGYGTFVEAACSGTPIIYLTRGNWPEEPWLIQWQQDKTYCKEISAKQLQEGDLMEEIEFACKQRCAPVIEPTGTDEIINHLLATISP